MNSKKVVICEDHNLTIDGLRVLISAHSGYVVAGHAHNEQELLDLLTEVEPDILILDINLGQENGFSILENIRPKYQALKILMLTMHDDPYMAEKSKQLKANGYLVKTANAAELMQALEGLYRQPFYESATAIKQRMNGFRQRDEFIIRMKLTKRELEIIQLVVQGYRAESISSKLFLSLHTVRTHKKNIMKKIEVNSTSDLVRYAIKNNLA